MYVTESGSTIAINKDGDIESVVVQGNDSCAALIEFAIQHGGTKLDSYDGNYGFYRHMVFEPVSYTKFNKEYADPAWKEGYNVEEDVIFFKYTGNKANYKNRESYDSEMIGGKMGTNPAADYDTAKEIRNMRM